jgi:hypothetical protein
VFVNLNTVFFLNHVVDTRGTFNIHIKDAAAVLTPEMMMLIGAVVVSFQTVRQRYLTDYSVRGKLTKIAVNSRFAY